jgi:hypothetical protein
VWAVVTVVECGGRQSSVGGTATRQLERTDLIGSAAQRPQIRLKRIVPLPLPLAAEGNRASVRMVAETADLRALIRLRAEVERERLQAAVLVSLISTI